MRARSRSLRPSPGLGGLLLGSLLAVSACGTAPPPRAPGPLAVSGDVAPSAPPVDAVFTEGILRPPAVVVDPGDPILGSTLAEHPEVLKEVHYWILRWQTWGEGYFHGYLERMGRYAGIVEAAVEERELPPSLRYLPLIESGYNPRASSPMGAVGMWQFMRGTALFLGLEVSPVVDERRDPWAATAVALDYLAELHRKFNGSWYLAVAAYNGGPGRTERTLRRHAPGVEPSDSLFWALREHFPAETRDFVPKLLAAAEVGRRPGHYGFHVEEDAPEEVVGVEVPDATSVDVLARAAGVEAKRMEALNPHLLRGYTTPGKATTVRVPADRADAFQREYGRIPPEERVSFVEHKLRRGETLSHVADQYRVSLRELRAANGGLNPRRLQIGQWIVVPRAPSAADGSEVRAIRGGEGQATASDGGGEASLPDEHRVVGEAVVHTVRSGESLWTIARRHGVGVAGLRRWNDLEEDEPLHPGDELRVYGGWVVVYQIRPGDTISEIADRHGVPTADLLRVNGLSRRSVIRPGETVRIPRPGS